MMERSHDPFKQALSKACEDANTLNWPALVPIVQGQMNNRVKRGFTRSPYEMVFGTTRREGYKNNQLPRSILRALTNEAGVKAVKDAGLLAKEDEVLAAVKAAQGEPLQALEVRADDDDDGGEMSEGEAATENVNRRKRRRGPEAWTKPVPAVETVSPKSLKANAVANAWRKYNNPIDHKAAFVPAHKPHPRDSTDRQEKKVRFHETLERIVRQFIMFGMWEMAHKVVWYLDQNNRQGQVAMTTYTPTVRDEFLAAIPGGVTARLPPSSVIPETPAEEANSDGESDGERTRVDETHKVKSLATLVLP
jgi:hypothetical protein